jgi:hypothetical protein
LTYRERPDAAGTWRLARIDLPRGCVRSEQRQVSKISGGFYDKRLYIDANFGNFKFKRADDFKIGINQA